MFFVRLVTFNTNMGILLVHYPNHKGQFIKDKDKVWITVFGYFKKSVATTPPRVVTKSQVILSTLASICGK